MNIAFVVLDTLRKDAFEEYFNWLPGRRYDNAWTTSHWTAPVHASLFTGKYASEIGVHSKSNTLDCEEPVLAEQLSDSGYTTKAFSANPNISKRFNYHRGFDQFEGSWKIRHFNSIDVFDWWGFINKTRGNGPIRYLDAVRRCIFEDVKTVKSLKQGFKLKFRPDKIRSGAVDDGAQTALERIRETEYGENEFLFLNLMEAHGPYEPPEEYQSVKTHDKPTAVDALTGRTKDINGDAVRQAYSDAVRYLSDMYKKIFSELQSEFDYVITLSDHGEMLGEHGLWDHQYGLYPELTHIPLVISGPDVSGSTDTPVSLIDVHRTVLDLAEIDAPSRGHNLLQNGTGTAYLTEYHGLTTWLLDELEEFNDFEAIRNRYDTPLSGIVLPPSYYGYETDEDWVSQGSTDSDPRDRLDTLRDDLKVHEADSGQEELSKEAMARLEDLGYA